MSVRRLILLVGAIALIAGVIALMLPWAASQADNSNPGERADHQLVPHTDLVA